MLAMLSRLSRSRRPGFSLQLICHFSIRVRPLKKQSLVAQLLRGKASPKLTSSTKKGEVFLDAVSQKGEASLRSVHPPPCLSAELRGFENGRQKEDDADNPHIAKNPSRSSKGVRCSDVAAKLSVREGWKEDPCKVKAELPGLSKLSVPSRIKGSKAHCSIGATQPCVEAQAASKRSAASGCDVKPFQPQERKVYAQPQIVGEEGQHGHIPAETKPSGKSSALQIWGASKNQNSPPDTGFSKEISSLVSAVGDEPGKCTERKLSSSGKKEEDEIQNAGEHNIFLLKSAVEREIHKRLEVEKHVELYSEIIRKGVTDTFLNDWQRMSAKTDRFFDNLQQKIELVSAESVALIHVKVLLMNREFLSVLPQKLAEMLTILKQFFESSDKACEILARNPKMMMQQLEKLQDRLKVFVEFEVDKAAGYTLATKVMYLSTGKLKRQLILLKDLGLSAESRNRIICKAPRTMSYRIENFMQSNVNFFESIEIARPTVMKLLESCPKLFLTCKNLRVLYKLFQHVGLSSMEYIEAVGQLNYIQPDVFLHYDFFRKQGLSDEAFVGLLKRNPKILSLPVELLEAKLHFLLHKAKWDISDALAFPCYFNYNLANRIIPRFKLLEELNLAKRPMLSTVVASPTFVASAV